MSQLDGPSPHLSWAELGCKDEDRTPYPEELRATRGLRLGTAYEALREECGGKPLFASRSQHPQGTGIDVAQPLHIHVYGDFVAAAFRARERRPDLIKGVGIYPGRRSIHIDVRETEWLAVWTA